MNAGQLDLFGESEASRTFGPWLEEQRHRRDAVGILARRVRDEGLPVATAAQVRDYLAALGEVGHYDIKAAEAEWVSHA